MARTRLYDSMVHHQGEAAYFTSSAASADEYLLYVAQIERQTGEWVWVGGYAGEAVTRLRSSQTFAPDRGLSRAIVAAPRTRSIPFVAWRWKVQFVRMVAANM